MGGQLLWATSEPLISHVCIMSPVGPNLKLWKKCSCGSFAHPGVMVVARGGGRANRKAEWPGTMRNQTWTETPLSSLALYSLPLSSDLFM